MNWTPGKRIRQLPRILWPAAMLARNVYINYLYRPKPWERDVYRTLAAAVSYVHIAAVPGDIAEFGTMTGRTARILARSLVSESVDMADSGPRRLLLFDSFEGLPEATHQADLENIHVADGSWAPGTCKGLSPAELAGAIHRILPPERVQVIQGWFSETVAALPECTQLAFIHIDCDLYQSTIDVLEGLFARKFVVAGTVILFDDWLCNRASPEHGEQKAWREITKKYDVRYTDAGPYGGCSWRFIVHSYRGVTSP